MAWAMQSPRQGGQSGGRRASAAHSSWFQLRRWHRPLSDMSQGPETFSQYSRRALSISSGV
eukprot:14769520-Alexandrium_andersonii.AAC.1